ncbi:MAG TPA: UDP-N-acetylmuramoyl-L-alanine--D-glutamate ligase [Acidimicrobiales bacterium]|nr:UDP-N-acetylmuramoyl-L-alanine--D-glutamate ligase [Acidimicrobiales bacterium]
MVDQYDDRERIEPAVPVEESVRILPPDEAPPAGQAMPAAVTLAGHEEVPPRQEPEPSPAPAPAPDEPAEPDIVHAVSVPAEPPVMPASAAAPVLSVSGTRAGSERALVVGLGRSGQAVARHLLVRGSSVAAVDDARAAAGALGILLVERPTLDALANLVVRADVVVPSPGVPASHPVYGLARAAGVPVRGEVELASRWSICPLVAVTGTNGKTTVTSLVADMLNASGIPSVAAGNIGLPLSDAVANEDLKVVVAEVSSFQLAFVESFRPVVAVWLNVAPDHLDWHGDVTAYVAAKARIWARQGPNDVAVVNADDPEVMAQATSAPSRVVTFGLGPARADFTVVDGWLRSPDGPLMEVAALSRSLPHDVANALAASAAALAAGATVHGVRSALAAFAPLPHRLTLVAYSNGVRWYDDSKATNPHATVAAVRGFESVVLLAGGRNKGLDLSELSHVAPRIRAVVAIGEAAPEVAAAFQGRVPVQPAASMAEAVVAAAAAARPGDVVLLSPGAASFDWYRSYAERGDDFAAAVHALLEAHHGD